MAGIWIWRERWYPLKTLKNTRHPPTGGSRALPTPVHITLTVSDMASTAIDIEQSSLNQRSVNVQVSLDCEDEKPGFEGGSQDEENPGNSWRPQDA